MKKKNKQKNKQKKSARKIVKIVLIALLIIAVSAFIVFAGITINAYLKDSEKNAAFALTKNGQTYTADAGGVVIHSGDEIGVVLLKGDGVYQVEISPNLSEENDFEFKVGNEPFQWSDTANKKFTGGFKLTQTEGGFKIEFTSLSEIISSAYPGRNVTVDEAVGDMDIFKLTVTYGEESISLSFLIGKPKLEIDKPDITF